MSLHLQPPVPNSSDSVPNWLVFSDDWGRHPSSCQYLIRELMGQVKVTWVNTIGTRTPRLDLATLRRAAGKLGSLLRSQPQPEVSTEQLGRPVPNVLNPIMWPWFTRQHDRALNRWLLVRRLRRELRYLQPLSVAVTTIPIVADLVGRLPVERWVYYCVDDFSAWPGLDQATMLEMERELVAKVDHIVVVSEVLQKRMQAFGRDATLLTHGVDVQAWNIDDVTPYAWPAEIVGPVALFWGVVDRRLDSDFVIELSKQVGAIVLVGPQQDPDPRLFRCSNVHRLPAVDAKRLPSMARSAQCLIMPYTDTAVTQAMQPLKLKEYLATGRPVVARSLPATQAWQDACDVIDSPREFALQVSQYLRGQPVPLEQSIARRRLASEGWSSKATQFLDQIQSRPQLADVECSPTPTDQ